MFTKVLACTDGTDRSLRAVEAAVDIARTQHAELALVYICRPPTVHDAFIGAPTIAEPHIERYITEMSVAVIERALPMVKQAGLKCEIITETGDPSTMIARIAERRGFDLIVMGSRGLGTEAPAHLGSAAYGVIHAAHCPVLVVR